MEILDIEIQIHFKENKHQKVNKQVFVLNPNLWVGA